MKIAFTGSGATGKTSLLHFCQNDIKFKNYSFSKSETREIYQQNGYSSEYEQREKTFEENAVLQTAINQSESIRQSNLLQSDDIISDRIMLDRYAYTAAHGYPDATDVKFIQSVLFNINQYDLVCYFQPLDIIDIEDAFRDTSLTQMLVDTIIKEFLNNTPIRGKLLAFDRTMSNETRIKKIKDEIKRH